MKNYIFFILAVPIILGFAFYWYSYKPSKIRGQCLAEAEFSPSVPNNFDDKARFEFIDIYYKNCLHRFGLEN